MADIDNSAFVVTDVETTGSDAKKNRIIEIACVTVHGGELTDKYSSLVNPHQFIPPFIANMTGISNEMAFNAPEAEDVFPEVHRLFSGNGIFVAHNVTFDWNFVNQSLLRFGLPELTNRQLCTLKLARKLLPNNNKKNVGALAKYFGVKVKNRHRALGDAEATAYILQELIDIAHSEHAIDTAEELLKFQNKRVSFYRTHQPTIKRVESKLSELPGTPGVYYFHGKNSEILYIGKAKLLKQRVKSYFQSNVSGKKTNEMIKKIYSIEWKQTNTELEALLLESHEIKKHKPPFNVLSRKYRNRPFLKITNDKFPKIVKTSGVKDDGAEYFGPFAGRYQIDNILENLQKAYKLRECNDIPEDDSKDRCFFFQIERCNGSPCTETEKLEEYNSEVEKVRHFLLGFSDTMIDRLSSRMEQLSENMEFEEAAQLRDEINNLRKIFANSGKIPNSPENSNMIVLLRDGDSTKTVQVYYIKHGRLKRQHTIGKKSPVHEIENITHEVFFNGESIRQSMNVEEIEELNIVNKWLRMNKENCEIIHVKGIGEDEIVRLIKQKINTL